MSEHLKQHQFKPGHTGNAAGRPKGLARLVRETVGDDMPKIILAQVAIAQGKKPDGYKGADPKPSEITKAAEWVRDTGWHKPRQTVDLEGSVAVGTADLSKLSREELEDWLAASDRAEDEQDDDGPAGQAQDAPPG